MIGKDFWENMEIDAIEQQQNVELIAKSLIDKFGPDITEADLLKMNAFSDSMHDPIQTAIVRASLTYFSQQDYSPEWIHSDMEGRTIEKKNIWKKLKKSLTLFQK